jgi:hypothetical protein
MTMDTPLAIEATGLVKSFGEGWIGTAFAAGVVLLRGRDLH